MRGFRLCLTLATCALLLLPGAARADNGPHGGFTATTDKCAACHRAHTAIGESLLTQATVKDLCYSCHGTGRQGSTTDVQLGMGNAGAALRGGGFQYVTMNTTGSAAAPGSAPVSSAHSVEGTGTVWGYGAINATADPGLAGVAMACTACHDPHGGSGSNGQATYRILRTQPQGVPAGGSADVTDQATKVYSISANNAGSPGSYFGQHYTGTGADLAKWCSQCHTRHLAGAGSFTTSSGDAVYAFRHRTYSGSETCMNCHNIHGTTQWSGAVSCVACHVAHGTSATMAGFATAVPYPDGQANEGSALLRMDGRGVCVGCHENP